MQSNKSDKTCLKKIPKRNIITRIYKKFYITVYNPIVIQIICENFEYFIQIIEDSYLINEKNCFINGSFYSYNPRDATHSLEPYEMKISDKIYTINFWKTENLESEEFITLISLIICILLSFVLAIVTIVCVAKNKINELREIVQQENTHHEYATVDYYTNVYPFYGTEV